MNASSKDKTADGTKSKRHRDDECNLSVSLMELLRHRRKAESHQKKVEGIEQPSSEAGCNRGPMIVDYSGLGNRRQVNGRGRLILMHGDP